MDRIRKLVAKQHLQGVWDFQELDSRSVSDVKYRYVCI